MFGTLKMDTLALMGYEYAEGCGVIPPLESQFDVDCFNAGILNFNCNHDKGVLPVKEGMKQTWVGGWMAQTTVFQTKNLQ
jgi:hypothetical protein